MVKNHLKRLAMPITWHIQKKKEKFITRPSPGAHSFSYGIPLCVALKELVKCAKTTKEAKTILNNKTVNVDKRRAKDKKMIVGFMDLIELKDTKEFFRICLDKKGKLTAVPIGEKESALKPSKITGKTKLKKGLTQINLIDSRNILVKKDDYPVGDTLVLSLPEQEIKDHLRLAKGSLAYLIGGKHMGKTAVIEEVNTNKIKFKIDGELVETLRKYAFVIGKEDKKPAVTITEA